MDEQHFIATDTYVYGSRISLASEEYIRNLIPSPREMLYGCLMGFFTGVSIAWLPLGWLFGRGLWLSLSIAGVFAAVWFAVRHHYLRRTRLNFLRSAEAKQVP